MPAATVPCGKQDTAIGTDGGLARNPATTRRLPASGAKRGLASACLGIRQSTSLLRNAHGRGAAARSLSWRGTEELLRSSDRSRAAPSRYASGSKSSESAATSWDNHGPLGSARHTLAYIAGVVRPAAV